MSVSSLRRWSKARLSRRLGVQPLEDRQMLSVAPVGPEFRVNSFSASYQAEPSVAVAPDGGFVVAWENNAQDGSGRGVYAQQYNAAGAPQGGEFRVNTVTAGDQRAASVAVSADGDFVIAWMSNDLGTYDWNIQARRYSAAGVPQGGELRVNTFTSGGQVTPSVASSGDGGFVIAWLSSNQDGSDNGIYAQRYNDLGQPQAGEFRVNTFTTASQQEPRMDMDDAGNFVIAWLSWGQDGSGPGIYAQRYNAVAEPQGGEFRVNTVTNDGQSAPSVAMDADGDFVIAWQGQDSSSSGIFAQRYNAEGEPEGGEFQVNTSTTGSQNVPRVAARDSGSFVIVWQGGRVFAQEYSAAGEPQGSEFQVDPITDGFFPYAAMNAGGDLVVAWGTFHGASIYARRFTQTDPNVAPTIDAGGPYDVDQGSTVNLAGSASDPDSAALAYEWDLDGDAAFGETGADAERGDEVGLTPAFNAAGLPTGSVTVTFRVDDGEGGVATDTATINVLPDDGDPDDQISEAVLVGDGERVSGWILEPTDVDMVAFAVADGQKFAFDILAFGPPVNAFIRLFDAAGNELAANDNHNGVSEPFLEFTFGAGGTYYLGVSASGNSDYDPITGTGDGVGSSTGNYTLTVMSVESADPVGPEFRVGTVTAGDQGYPAAAKAANGDFVIAWVGYSPGSDVFAQRYNAAGEPQGSQFLVNTTTAGSQFDPRVAMDADGDFVIVWEGSMPHGGEIFGRRYNAAGVPQGDEFQVTAFPANQASPRVAMDADGNFVVTWMSFGQDGSDQGVFARRYDAAGAPQGDEFLVNITTEYLQHAPTVAMSSEGEFVIAWLNNLVSNRGLYAQRYDAQGVPQGGEFLVNTTAGTPQSPTVAMDGQGDFVITWGNEDGSSLGIFARRYDAAGDPQGDELRVNTYTAGLQERPVVTMNSAGEAVIVWQGAGAGDHAGIYAQRLDADGTPVGSEFRANTFIANTEHVPSVAIDPAGNFVVAWSSADFGHGGNHNGVYAQRFGLAVVADDDPDDEISEAVGVNDGEGVSGTISTGTDVDMVAVTAADGQTFAFDILVANGQLNAAIRLFDAAGNELAANDNHNGVLEPFLQFTFETGGTYYLGVSASGNSAYDPISGNGDSVGLSTGNYTLTIMSVESAGPVGPEFRVDMATAGDQDSPSVAKDADGNFVVVWRGWTPADPDRGADVFARLYNAAGAPQGDQFLVNTLSDSTNGAPQVAMDDGGDFVVVWQSYSDSNREIFAQKYVRIDIDGDSIPETTAPAGSEFHVNTHTAGLQQSPRVAMSADGSFVVAWVSHEQDGWGAGVFGQRYDAAGAPQGGEFLVNTTTVLHQHSPSVAMDPTGDFVIAWSSGMVGSGESDVYAQQYNAAGVPQGGEFLVNTDRDGTQHGPTAAADGAGGFVIAWNSDEHDGSGWGIVAQRFDAAGVPQGGELLVNTYTVGNQSGPAIAMNAAGDAVIAWYGVGAGDHAGIFAQRLHADGTPVGTEFRANTFIANSELFPSVAIDPAGNFVIVWGSFDNHHGGDHNGVYAQRYGQAVANLPPTADAGGPYNVEEGGTVILSGSATDPDSAVLTYEWDLDGDGSFGETGANAEHGDEVGLTPTFNSAGLPTGPVTVTFRVDDGEGGIAADTAIINVLPHSVFGPVGPEFRVNTSTAGTQAFPAVATAANGDFVIAWVHYAAEVSGDIMARRYSADGTPQGDEFLVNTFTSNEQRSPSVAIETAGDFVIVWASDGQDGSGWGVFAQRYSAEGAPQGGEFQVNTFTAGGQTGPDVAMDAGGAFVVTWVSNEQDGWGQGIYAQAYDAAGAPQGGEFLVNTSTLAHQRSPSVAADASGDFVIAWESGSIGSGDSNIYAQRYDAAGVPQDGEFQVNPYGYSHQGPSAAMDATGRFVIAWSKAEHVGDDLEIYAQRFDAAGVPQDGAFHVNTYTLSNQLSPVVAMDADGDFVVVWYGAGEDDDFGVFAQRYHAAGTPENGQFRVNTHTADHQADPSVAMDAAGNFVVAWSSTDFGHGSGDHNGIYAQRFALPQVNVPPTIIDNSESGFELTGAWAGGGGPGVGRMGNVYVATQLGANPDVASWTFDVAPGRYRVSATWYVNLAFSHLFAGAAPFTVVDAGAGLVRGTTLIDQRHVPDDFVYDGSAWEAFGEFEITGGSLRVELRSVLPSPYLVYVVADAICIQRIGDLHSGGEVQVTADAANVADGGGTVSFGTAQSNHPLQKTFTISNTGAQPIALTGEVTVTPGSGFTVVSQPAANTLYPGQSTTFTVQMDGTASGVQSGTISFATDDSDENPFDFTVTGTVLTTQILDDSYNPPAAGEPGFRKVGAASAWGYSAGILGRELDIHYTYPAYSPAQDHYATWTFNVVPGQYRVAATWFAGLGAVYANNAPFTVYDDGTDRGTAALNQEIGPSSFLDQGSMWQDLGGVYDIASNTLIVKIGVAGAEGFIAVDAIRIERIGDLPPEGNVESGAAGGESSSPGGSPLLVLPVDGSLRTEESQETALDASLATIYWNDELDDVATALAEESADSGGEELAGDIATAAEIGRSTDEVFDAALDDWLE